jgi:hypothetical protein
MRIGQIQRAVQNGQMHPHHGAAEIAALLRPAISVVAEAAKVGMCSAPGPSGLVVAAVPAMTGNLDPLQRLLLGVSESSKARVDDDEPDDEPSVWGVPDAPRTRRPRDRSFKKTNRAQFHRTPRTGR